MKKKFLLLLSSMVLFAVTITAQVNVKGKVVDDKGEPMVGSTVVVKGTPIGTVTDIDGTYSLSVPPGSTTLVFSFVGFDPIEETIGNRRSGAR